MLPESVSNRIPVDVNIDPRKHSLNSPSNSSFYKRVHNDTWEIRYKNITSETGYDNGKQTIKSISIEQWLKQAKISEANPSPLFIEGSYIYNSINKKHLFVDFTKLAFCSSLRRKIGFFSLYKEKDTAVHRLYSILKRANYHLDTKLQNEDGTETIMPELALYMMVQAYEAEPVINHILLMAEDAVLVPFIQHMRTEMNIKMTLAISDGQYVSNYYLNQFDYFISVLDLMKYADALEKSND